MKKYHQIVELDKLPEWKYPLYDKEHLGYNFMQKMGINHKSWLQKLINKVLKNNKCS